MRVGVEAGAIKDRGVVHEGLIHRRLLRMDESSGSDRRASIFEQTIAVPVSALDPPAMRAEQHRKMLGEQRTIPRHLKEPPQNVCSYRRLGTVDPFLSGR